MTKHTTIEPDEDLLDDDVGRRPDDELDDDELDDDDEDLDDDGDVDDDEGY